MKNLIFIITLCILQAACSSHRPAASSSASLLTFEQIGSEISVIYEELDEAVETPTGVAAGH